MVALAIGCEQGASDEDMPASTAGSGGDESTGNGGSSGSDTGTTSSDSSGSESGELIDCDDTPVITYDTFGAGFLATYCNGCHGGQVVDRKGAPAAAVFDTREQVMPYADKILYRLAPPMDVTPMPPAGGVTPDDEARIAIWLMCFP